MPTKTNARPRRTKRACAMRGKKLKLTGDKGAAARLARYCPPPGRRRKANAIQREPFGGETRATAALSEWREMIPAGTTIYFVLRRQSPATARAVAEPVYVAADGSIRYVPPNASIMAGFAYDYPHGGSGGVILPNGAGSVQDYVNALGRLLHNDARSLARPAGFYL